MTSIQTTTGNDSQPREWSISNQTLIVSADSNQALAVLNGGEPLLLPPGSVLQFGHPLGELVVTRVRVIVGEGAGIVCLEAEPETGRYRASPGPGHPAERPGYLRLAPNQPPKWSRVRPGNG